MAAVRYGYDLIFGERRVASVTTSIREDGTHDILFHTYAGSGGATHDHVWYSVDSRGGIAGGGHRLKDRNKHVGDSAPVVGPSTGPLFEIRLTQGDGQGRPTVELRDMGLQGIRSAKPTGVLPYEGARTPKHLQSLAKTGSIVYQARLYDAATLPATLHRID